MAMSPIGIRPDGGFQYGNVQVEIDEVLLKEIATTTGGQYFRARNQQELETIYQTINKLEPIDSDFLQFRPEKNLFYWPLAAALMILSAHFIYVKLRGSYAA